MFGYKKTTQTDLNLAKLACVHKKTGTTSVLFRSSFI